MTDAREDYEEVEIEIIREVWNTYDLEDGSRLKARTVLTKILWPGGVEITPGELTQISIGAKLQNIIVVFNAPEKLRGPPNPRPPSVKEAAKLKKEEVSIVNSEEEWNYYRISKSPGGVKLKMVVTDIFRVVDVYDQDGDPYYIVSSQAVLGLMTPGQVPSP